MRRVIPLLLVGLALAAVTASFVRRGCCDAQLAASAGCGDTGRWFRSEFGADAATCAAIRAEQAKFSAECAKHCVAVAEAESALAKLPAGAPAAERAGAEAALRAARDTCHAERVAFARRIAGMLSPEAGKRYLDIVLPRLAKLDHAGSPDAAGHR